MGRLSSAMSSPIQRHRMQVADDVVWIDGQLETLGDPHNYINQDGLDFLRALSPQIAPWSFTGLPVSRPAETVIARSHIQMLLFPDEATRASFRKPPRTAQLILNLPLVVVRGSVPFLGEAKLINFLDFWKGVFLPVMDANLHFLAESEVSLPTQAQLMYINREAILHYVQA